MKTARPSGLNDRLPREARAIRACQATLQRVLGSFGYQEVDTPILAQRPTPVPPEKRAQMLTPDDVAACVLLAAKLPPRVVIPELVVTPLYQEFA